MMVATFHLIYDFIERVQSNFKFDYYSNFHLQKLSGQVKKWKTKYKTLKTESMRDLSGTGISDSEPTRKDSEIGTNL